MTSPVLALRAAIRSACLADASLATLMDPSVHDEAPRLAAPVYATFGDADLKDASSSTETGHEQEIGVLVWARRQNMAGALAAAKRLADLLEDRSLTLVGHRLVSLAVLAVEVRPDEAGGPRVALRLRAVTEALV